MTIATLRERILELLVWDGARSVDEITDHFPGVNRAYIRSAIALLMADGLVEGSTDGVKVQAVRNG